MGSLLGFHPPHFSEEEAWLPAWLQPSTTREATNQAVECPALEDIGRLQQSISTGENGNLSDDGTRKNLHLFLSGEDNSQMIVPSCSSNHEVQYHLHLSSNEESQYSLNPTLGGSQEDKFEFNQALLVQQEDGIVIPEEGEAYLVPSQQEANLGITGPNSPSLKDKKEVNPKVEVKFRKDDIIDAIELAVAASEALTIHKVLKDELLASFVLEAAIRVKQARLENFRENISSSIEESNEVDFDILSDLDYLTMAGAYEDVGLTFTSHGDPSDYGSISHVNDSFASETYISSAKHKCNERGGLEVRSGSISPRKHNEINDAKVQLKGSILESFECVTRKEQVDYDSVATKNTNLACDVDPVFNCSVDQTDYCVTEVGLQREGFSIGDLTSSKTLLRSMGEREDKMTTLIPDNKMTTLVPDRFQSRWFGGWTWKNEVSIPAVTNDECKRSVPELYADETSSLSESADIAPDMSSCVQRQDEGKHVYQSSVASQCAYEKAINNGNLISDSVAVSPNVSPMDPLCSVVPCSITSDSVISQNSKQQATLEKHLSPTGQLNLDNLEVNGKSSPTVHRQMASLKTYSMIYPRCHPYLDKEHTLGVSSSFEQNQTAKADTELTGQRKEITMVARKVESIVPRRKRVRFSQTEISFPQEKNSQKAPQTRLKDPLVAGRNCRRLASSKCRPHNKDNKMLFHNLKFLLTGFSIKKHKQIKNLILKNGGMVFDEIPSPSTSRRKRCSKLPLILCPKKLLTTKFLYGCAVHAVILNVAWLFDSVDEGLILPHQKYKVLSDHASINRNTIGNPVRYNIFDNVAIMLNGKPDFCSKMAIVIKHGGGLVFKTFHWLAKSLDSKRVSVGVVVVEDEKGISRQLKQCALEQSVPMMPFNWIINSLYAGRLLLQSPRCKLPDHLEMSEEI